MLQGALSFSWAVSRGRIAMKVPHIEEKPGQEQLGFASLENADRLRNLGSFRAAEDISGSRGVISGYLGKTTKYV